METITLLQLIVFLIGGGASGALISYYLNKHAKEEEKKGIKKGIFVEIRGNLNKIENAIEKKEKLKDEFFKKSNKLSEFLSDKELEKVNSSYDKIEKFNELIQVLKTNFNDSFVNELKKDIPSLGQSLLDIYEIFVPDDIDTNIGIIKGENIPIGGGFICGHHGIAPPEFFFKKLNKYGAQYINPIDVLDINKLNKFKIIINPYGEYYFLADRKDQKQNLIMMVDIIKKFIEKDGIWVHAGGYPFHNAVFLKTGETIETGGIASRNLGLIIEGGDGSGTITTTNKIYLIEYMTWRCEHSRNLQNCHEVYAIVETKKGKSNIFASFNIGKGKFIHYGGMHSVPEEAENAAEIICKLIKYYAITLCEKEMHEVT